MTALTILAILSAAAWAYMLVHALRHDPPRPDQAPPRSHLHEAPPQPWYAAEPWQQPGRWAA